MDEQYRINDSGVVQRRSDGAFISPAPDHRDQIAYQAWLAAGNTPLAAGSEWPA